MPSSTNSPPNAQPPQRTSTPPSDNPLHGPEMSEGIQEPEDVRTFDQPDEALPPLPTEQEDSFLRELVDSQINNDSSALMDPEMKRKLMDIESSFIPEASVQAEAPVPTGADDTYLFGGSPGHARPQVKASKEDETPASPSPRRKKKPRKLERRSIGSQAEFLKLQDEAQRSHTPEPTVDAPAEQSSLLTNSPPTPADAYKTPGIRRPSAEDGTAHDLYSEPVIEETSTSDAIPSSPAAMAAERNLHRGTSNPRFADASEEADEAGDQGAVTQEAIEKEHPDGSHRPTSSASTVKAPEFTAFEDQSSLTEDHDMSIADIPLPSASAPPATNRISKRPSYLQNRHASQRSSLSSFTNKSDVSLEGGSDATLGADYTSQSGEGRPPFTGHNRSSFGLSRLPSLGSIASSVSGYSDPNPPWDRSSRSVSGAIPTENSLARLEEEPATPRAPDIKVIGPTDTVLARHVQDIRVPDTIAKEYREKHLRSPDKRSTPLHSRNKHNLTLKEQNSKIDKLSKENFDLKLKIHFLDQALQHRSDASLQEVISKNVQLNTDLANEKKENQTLRRKIRDLERRLKAQEEGLAAARETNSTSDDEQSDQTSGQAEFEEEMIYLREQLEILETTIEQLREENLSKEIEKRRLGERIHAMGERTSEPSAGVNEAMDMWNQELENERVRRQQAETEAQQLREEVQRLKEQNQSATNIQNIRNVHNVTRRTLTTSFTTRSNSGSDVNEQAATMSGTSGTLVEQLRSENAELRRDLGAQTSMLTSRNRERERLQQEIENLKLTARRGDVASVAGDSIFERSISRAHQRSVSRASGRTGGTPLSDAERDDYEARYATLRDENSQTKLVNQDLERELNTHLNILEETEKELDELKKEFELQTEDLQAIQAERDEALEALQDKEQECEKLREEALGTIERLEDEIETKEQERTRLITEIENQNEDFNALQQEMKQVSESLVQLEDDHATNLRKIQNLEQELDDANRELETLDKRLADEKAKNERLDIQLESCQGEISFLREEQEGDKIKIGELESALNSANNTIEDEKERFRDLEHRLSEERRQRDILDSQEKEQVQKILDDLNLQASKAKDEVRKLRKNLSSKEVEATTWKQRLDELESHLREALGNLNGTRSSLLKDVTKLQRDLDTTIQELGLTKADLAEKDRLLRNRDGLLESTGMESRRLSDLLDRERQARRADQTAFETAKRGHQTVTRTMQQHELRVQELETARSQDRSKIATLERQYKDQLLERNNLLLALWNRLSTLCGAEWARSNALVNGEIPSLELIARNIAGFSKNMILAVKTVENIVGGFRQRIRMIEKDLWKDYQTLEHSVDVRAKRLEQLEKAVMEQRRRESSIGRVSTIRGGVVDTGETKKLKEENKTLRQEVHVLRERTTQINTSTHTHVLEHPPPPSRSPSMIPSPATSKRASVAQTLLRGYSTSAVETVSKASQNQGSEDVSPYPPTAGLQPSEQRWIHRLKELERRLKQEREARLLDRSGARQRLEESSREKEELRMALEREKGRRLVEGGSVDGEGEEL